MPQEINFIKMNGAGNDFIIFDERKSGKTIELSKEQIQAISARDNKITGGCDQLIVMDAINLMLPSADIAMIIYNADGNEVTACGNATRCIAWLMIQETKKDEVIVQTDTRNLYCYKAGDKKVKVNMGSPIFDAAKIQIDKKINPKKIPISYGVLKDGMAVGMGNPHVIFFVDDANTKDLEDYGKKIEQEHTEIFPYRVNVSAAQIVDRNHIKLRVWERGAGITKACGTGACATLVASVEKNLTERKADIEMEGGTLTIEWNEKNEVWMTGAVEIEFSGKILLD